MSAPNSDLSPLAPLNVLLVTLGSAGDVYPFVMIGRALLRRGHTVTLITSAHFRQVVTDASIEFVGLGTPEDYSQVTDDPDLWDPRRAFRVFARRVVIPAISPVYEAISNWLRHDTVIVAQGQAFGAHFAHERHGIPFVTINLQPAAFRTAYDSPLFPSWLPTAARPLVNQLVDFLLIDRELAGPVNSLRSQIGLPPIKHILGSWAHSPQRTIGLFPEWFARPQPDWPHNMTLAGFVLLTNDPRPASPALIHFLDNGTPPIIFTPGTEMRHARAFFESSLRALAKIRRRGVFLSRHKDQLPSALPEDVISIPHMPFASLLHRAAAVVHHGGIGTIAHAFASGLPQLIRPMAHDQPDNAARVERLGVGVTVRPRRYTPERVASSLQSLLASENVARACQFYSTKVNATEALSVVCTEIEEVAVHYAA